MAQQEVHSSGQIPVSADRVWSTVRDFCGTWHPAIATMNAEYDSTGCLTRAFTVHGDDTTYRERMTWFSDSERSLAYTHVEGIAGVESYDARMDVVAEDDAQCTVTLTAKLTAAEPRASEIATGTSAIFDEAISAIKAQSELPAANPNEAVLLSSDTLPRIRTIEGSPSLAVSYCAGPNSINDTLCLFLHGIGGNRSNWNEQLATVAPYCNVAAMDLRGYGDSESGKTQSSIEDYCADILRVADSLGGRQLILCGLSYGAWIATSFAMRHPQRLAALVLSGGCTGMSEASTEEREGFRRSREVPMSEGKTPSDFAPDVVKILAGPDCTEQVKAQLLESMQTIDSGTYADALRCFTNPTETFDFGLITMPVLLMTGDADKLAPPDEIKQIATRIHNASPSPDVRFECLQRAGHLCNLEAPQAYNTPLLELIKRVLR